MLHQAKRSPISNCCVLNGSDRVIDLGTDLNVGILQLILARLMRGRLLALLQGCICGVSGIIVHCDNRLRVVHEKYIDILGVAGLAATL